MQQNFTLFPNEQQMQLERHKKRKHERIHGIRVATRLGKDSPCSSFPSLETHEVPKKLLQFSM